MGTAVQEEPAITMGVAFGEQDNQLGGLDNFVRKRLDPYDAVWQALFLRIAFSAAGLAFLVEFLRRGKIGRVAGQIRTARNGPYTAQVYLAVKGARRRSFVLSVLSPGRRDPQQ